LHLVPRASEERLENAEVQKRTEKKGAEDERISFAQSEIKKQYPKG